MGNSYYWKVEEGSEAYRICDKYRTLCRGYYKDLASLGKSLGFTGGSLVSMSTDSKPSFGGFCDSDLWEKSPFGGRKAPKEILADWRQNKDKGWFPRKYTKQQKAFANEFDDKVDALADKFIGFNVGVALLGAGTVWSRGYVSAPSIYWKGEQFVIRTLNSSEYKPQVKGLDEVTQRWIDEFNDDHVEG